MADIKSAQVNQNEPAIEYSRSERLVKLEVDALKKTFSLEFDNNRLMYEDTGQVVVKCRLPGKESMLTLRYGQIDESTLGRLLDLSFQQQQMRMATDHRQGRIAGWLEKSLSRIWDLRLGREMLDVLSNRAKLEDAPFERRPALRFYINQSLRKEVDLLTRNLRVRSDGLQQIEALLDLTNSNSSPPILRYGLNAVNFCSAPHLIEALERIAEELNLPEDVRRSAASLL
jgi:hypothetical protein